MLLPFYTMRLRRAVMRQVAGPEASKHTGVHIMRKFGHNLHLCITDCDTYMFSSRQISHPQKSTHVCWVDLLW